MRSFLKNSAIVLALAGTALMTAAAADAQGFSIGVGTSHGGRHNTAISVGFGDVAFGYRDGYWDNGHRWHRWNSDRDYRNYRANHNGYYRDWNHDRDGGDGWARGVNFNFDDIAFGYRDGYWDNGRRWHRWSNDRDYRNYRSHYAGNYRDWNHNRDGNDGWDRGRGDNRDRDRNHGNRWNRDRNDNRWNRDSDRNDNRRDH